MQHLYNFTSDGHAIENTVITSANTFSYVIFRRHFYRVAVGSEF